MHKAVEDYLSDAFLSGFEEAKTRLKDAPYHFVEGVLTEMGTKGFLDEMFERNLER